jgi:hypothetical protein
MLRAFLRKHKKTLKAYFQEKIAFFDKTFLSGSPGRFEFI